MKALVFDGNLAIQERPKPEPQEDEALIRVRMAGICNTDIEITKGYMDFTGILGHEFVGEVIECRSEKWIGKRAVGEINIGCGICEYCQKDMHRHCPSRNVLGISGKDGAFAEYVTLPAKNLVAVPDGISDEEAVFIEPIAAACEILEQVHIQPIHRVAIVGDGKLGQLIARVLYLTGCRLTVFGMSRVKLSLLDGMRIDTHITNSPTNEKFDVVVEASGSPSGFLLAMDLVKPRGIFILKSTIHENIVFNTARMVINEIQLIGSRCGRFEPAVRLLDKGLIDVKPLIAKKFTFNHASEAFEVAKDPKSLKVLIEFGKNGKVA